MKDIGDKNSITHGAGVWANSIMNAMTTNDAFLRDNLNWVAKATNWGRFTATASIGTIHYGNQSKAEELIDPYITGVGAGPSSPYQTAGAYYAYGLIHANQRSETAIEYLMGGYRNSGGDETI